MSVRNSTDRSPLVPDDAPDRPDVVLKKQVLKLGMDGSSLPRLVVVTAQNVYICLPSGGITRTVAIARVERVTLCPREDMLNDEHEQADSTRRESSTVRTTTTARNSTKDVTTPPSSPSKDKRGGSRSPGAFFASFFSRGSGGGKGADKPQTSTRRSGGRGGYKEDVDETHPASPTDDNVDGGALVRQKSGQSSTTSNSNSNSAVVPARASAEWAVIITLGIAFEAPLALQLQHVEDGMELVAVLRASPFIADRAVFNMPDEVGPTNAAGEPLFSAPPRRAEPAVPRVLERDADKAEEEEEEETTATAAAAEQETWRPVEEVELSPSSPRSTTTAASPGLLPSPLTAAAPEWQTTERRRREVERGDGEPALVQSSSSAPQEQEEEQQQQQQQQKLSPLASSSSSSAPMSSKASSVHTAEPSPLSVAPKEPDAPPQTAAPVVVVDVTVPTPVQALQYPPSLPPPMATALYTPASPPPQQQQQPTQFLSSGANIAAIAIEEGLEGRTPSPLRAAPLREAPQPPPPLPPPLSTGEVSPVVPATRDSTRRTLRMYDDNNDDDAATTITTSAPAAGTMPQATSAPTAWEAIRDYETRAPLSFADVGLTTPSPLPTRTLRSPPRTDTSLSSMPEMYPPQRIAALQSAPQQQHAAAAAAPTVVRTPLHMEALQAELSQQSETVARLRRSLQAQESLLLELSELKAEVRTLRATLAERDAQCTEWQAAYTNAEAHIGALQRDEQHHLAAQDARLRAAHREELAAVQASFEDYDTRMTGFVDELQRDHREEAAQWQHERRILCHQLEEVRHAQEAGVRARTVADGSAWSEGQGNTNVNNSMYHHHQQPQRQSPSPPSAAAASYLDESRGYPSHPPRQHTGRDVEVYDGAQGRVTEKLRAYAAQQQRKPVPTATTTTPASPWPQPRLHEPTPAPPPPPSQPQYAHASSSRIVFGAHHLFDPVDDDGAHGTRRMDVPVGARAAPTAAAAATRARRDTRGGDALIQTPSSSSALLSEDRGAREMERRGHGGYVPHRRSFV